MAWYARAVIPKSTYDLDTDFFNRLQHESIRNLIFDESRVSLIERVVYPINNQNDEFHWVERYFHTTNDTLWLRNAQFSFQGRGFFYLIEILFPILQELTK